MLTKEDNELISQVDPGTPMGALMREYWVPAMLSSELPIPDCDPVRVMLLGEQLIGFRDTSGKVGLIANLCTHRGASLLFGRNAENGIRCLPRGGGPGRDLHGHPAVAPADAGVRGVPTSRRRVGCRRRAPELELAAG